MNPEHETKNKNRKKKQMESVDEIGSGNKSKNSINLKKKASCFESIAYSPAFFF